MSDDLIKRLQYLGRVAKDYDQDHMTSADYEMIPAVTKQAADRLEELERDNYRWKMECEEFWRAREAKAVEALPKLHAVLDILLNNFPTKARPKWVADIERHIDEAVAVLAELEGGNEPDKKQSL